MGRETAVPSPVTLISALKYSLCLPVACIEYEDIKAVSSTPVKQHTPHFLHEASSLNTLLISILI